MWVVLWPGCGTGHLCKAGGRDEVQQLGALELAQCARWVLVLACLQPLQQLPQLGRLLVGLEPAQGGDLTTQASPFAIERRSLPAPSGAAR